jgi:NAD(P)-dependent dehydrogenase (short-subunit alcohol dehydrogenase family)
MRVAGRTAAVTGASSGIGAAIAAALAAEGAGVLALARRFSAAAVRPPAPGELVAVPCDVTDEPRVGEVLAAAGPLDLLILAAGTGRFAPLVDTTPDALRGLLEVHAMGTLHCLRAALPAMLARGRGHVIGIGSTAEHRAFPDNAAYAAAKSAQAALLRVLAREVRERGVHVTRLILGAVDTPIWNARPGFDRAHMLTPAQVAEAVVDLAADPAPPDALDLLPPAGHL